MYFHVFFLFFSFFAQKLLKSIFLTSIWSTQHPNAVPNKICNRWGKNGSINYFSQYLPPLTLVFPHPLPVSGSPSNLSSVSGGKQTIPTLEVSLTGISSCISATSNSPQSPTTLFSNMRNRGC